MQEIATISMNISAAPKATQEQATPAIAILFLIPVILDLFMATAPRIKPTIAQGIARYQKQKSAREIIPRTIEVIARPLPGTAAGWGAL